MGAFERLPDTRGANFAPYAGRWVACVGGKIISQGGTPKQALAAAKTARHKETPEVFYVPTENLFNFSPIFDRIRRWLPEDVYIYLVGGAVRNVLISRPIHDFDFVVEGDALSVARRLASKIGGAYFPLDVERSTARVLYSDQEYGRYIIDFAALRAEDLDADLRDRDFTINAMAVSVCDPQALLDPLGGAADLHAKILRACSPKAFANDPIRILRAVRMAAAFKLSIVPETRGFMKDSVASLAKISPERLRDEILNILGGPRPATCIRALDMLGALEFVLPDLLALKGLTQSKPHTQDAWNHTLETLNQLENLLSVLGPVHDQSATGSLVSGLASMRLGRYRKQIDELLKADLVTDRSLRSMFFLSALYHDIGKPKSHQQDENGRIRFIEHERIGAKICAQRGRALHLSNVEIDWLKTIVLHHMRPTWLAREPKGPSWRAVYRFFRETKQAGIAVCLISLADLLATYGTSLPQDRWEKQLDVVRALMEAWWEKRDAKVDPPALLSGNDIIKGFDLNPGPMIGDVLEALRESQVEGGIDTREEALDFVRGYLDTK